MTYPFLNRRSVAMARAGFSLIELLIGIVIVGILAGGAMFTAMQVMNKAKRSTTETALQTLKFSIMGYKQEKGEYPKTLKDLLSLGGFKKGIPKDGWGQGFVYRVTPDGKHEYELYSYGPDGKKGNKASRIDAWSK